MMTYREEIRELDSLATPAPRVSDGELYGVHEHGSITALGFAPHRSLDSRLIVVYGSAVMHLIEAVDAVERLALRASMTRQRRRPSASARFRSSSTVCPREEWTGAV
jgi:hypothetical protein